MSDDAQKTPEEAFLEQYRKDQEAGSARTLSDYLALFPDDQDAIAAEYLALQNPKTSIDMALDAFGPYRLEKEIGRGGQGIVYRATDTRIDRTVALKVLRDLGPRADELLLRFKREATAASKTDHPGVCAVYDAEVKGGIPYIAMRYIEGETLAKRIATTRDGTDLEAPNSVISLSEMNFEDDPDTFKYEQDTSGDEPTTSSVSQSRSDIMRAVHLIEKTARALHAVHEAGIIHRDVKPGNVMVTPEGDAVVMDFGLARDEESDLQTLTRTGDLFGTPAYMSPEQLTSNRIRIDRRTDVWSLGVMLYECVTLQRPFQAPSRERLYQQILAKEPEAPRRLNPSIPKDLATVIATALDKDRDRRYQTALDLAEDLRRLRSYEPIVASPVGPVTRLLRWAQRNPAVAAALVLVLLSLSGGLFIALWQKSLTDEALVEAETSRNQAEKQKSLADEALLHAETERTRAEEALTHAEAVKDFLNDEVLGQVSPVDGDKNVLVRDILDKAAQNIEGKFAEFPTIEADIRTTIGTTYLALGEYDLALPHLERAFALRDEHLGEEHPNTLTSMNNLAVIHQKKGDYDLALPLFKQALESRRRTVGEEHPDTLRAMNNLAGLCKDQGKYDLARSLYEKVLEGQRHVLGEEHPNTVASMNNLGALYQDQREYDRALQLLKPALEISRRILGKEHPHTLASMHNLGLLYKAQGKYDLALPLFTKDLEVSRRVLGEEHPDTLNSMYDLGVLYRGMGKYDLALPLSKKAFEGRRRVLSEEHSQTLHSMYDLGALYYSQGQCELARPLLQKALEVRRRVSGKDHQWTLMAQSGLVGCLMKQKAYAKAEPLLLDLYPRFLKFLGAQHPAVVRSVKNLVDLYEKWGKPEEAAKWKAKLPGAENPDRLKIPVP